MSCHCRSGPDTAIALGETQYQREQAMVQAASNTHTRYYGQDSNAQGPREGEALQRFVDTAIAL